jgi:hypothetical protein|tara:strand:- start:856 stop:1155 length:300 start_codon:yes stop_codon:yes gene_type:complete
MSNTDDFDFGFTLYDEDELDVVQKASSVAEGYAKDALTSNLKAQDWEEKCNALYNAYKPLLNNLAKNPEKSYIYWPDRLEKLGKFSDMIDGIISPDIKG